MAHLDEAIIPKVRDMFAAVDSAAIDSFVTYLDPQVRFRFANGDPLIGREAVRESLIEFFKNFQSLRHDINEIWINGDTVICEQTVTYTKHDGSKVSPPCVNILKFKDDLIYEYLIYIDLAPLFA